MNSIIAYRNPLEQWFWEGGALYVGAALVVMFFVYCAYYFGKQILCKHKSTFNRIDGTHRCRDCQKVFGQGWVK